MDGDREGGVLGGNGHPQTHLERGRTGPALRNLGRDAAGHVSGIARELAHLVADEARLARSEIAEKTVHVKRGAGLAGAGGVALHAGVLFLLLGLVAWLATRWALWQAALLVGAIVLVLGAILLFIGKRQMSSEKLKPERTLGTARYLKWRAQHEVERARRGEHEAT